MNAFPLQELQGIMEEFGLGVKSLSRFADTSHGEEDLRFHYILDEAYVLKVCSAHVITENRLQEIARLIDRYRSIGVYCPRLLPTRSGSLSRTLEKEGKQFTCYVEEYAQYPLLPEDAPYDRREVVEHLGLLAARYTGVDLSPTKSMWSIIDLAPLDVGIDEKQENANTLIVALKEQGYVELGEQVEALNTQLRERILSVFEELPRCVYQGDLNASNLLYDNDRFAGLIDFNMAGTDVNINVFANETNWFPEEEELDNLSVEEILFKQDGEQAATMAPILRHYTINQQEQYALPCYQRIVNLFQYPNVCAMVYWLKQANRRKQCATLIQALTEKPL